MKAFKIPLHIFPVTVVCYIGDKANIARHCGRLLAAENIRYFTEYDTASYDGCALRFPDEQILLWFASAAKKPCEVALVAHEADHVVWYIFEQINADRRKECELSAYLLQYIVEQVLVRQKK